MDLQGLELSEKYFDYYGMQMITEKFSAYMDRIAVGLVGDGSECFGFDDEFSRDHDWGPGFCLWLTNNDYEKIGAALEAEFDKLPKSFAGFEPRVETAISQKRVGVFEIVKFYWNFIGLKTIPANLNEWLAIPEASLAVCTNGKVFYDPLGEFTRIRNRLKEFYPRDVQLKKIAARCMNIAQYGQYNFRRCVHRKEYVAASYAEAKFCSDVISLVFLLNKEYKPFFKWMHRAVRKLPLLGEYTYLSLNSLVTSRDYELKCSIIEEICAAIIEELQQQGISDSVSDFLLDHGPVIQASIQDANLRVRNVWVG